MYTCFAYPATKGQPRPSSTYRGFARNQLRGCVWLGPRFVAFRVSSGRKVKGEIASLIGRSGLPAVRLNRSANFQQVGLTYAQAREQARRRVFLTTGETLGPVR